MKKFQILMIVGLFLIINSFRTFAQPLAPLQTIDSYPLYTTYFKTTSIIFPQAIVSVDRGSKDILVQKAKGVDNILQVKAARDSFPETNLTVITADGKLNSFILNYTEQPAVLNLSLIGGRTLQAADTALFSSEHANQATLQAGAKAAYVTNKKIHGIKDNDFGIRFQLNGLFIHDDVLYFRIKIENESNISYDIDQLRFFIRDQKKAKRTATQEVEVKPLYIYNDTEKVKGQTQQIMVFALPKFTIPDKKKLIIQFMEAHGGRHLEVQVKNKTIVKANILSL